MYRMQNENLKDANANIQKYSLKTDVIQSSFTVLELQVLVLI